MELYVALQRRYDEGLYADLRRLEDTLSKEAIAQIKFLMNSAFDAGQVEQIRPPVARVR